MNGVLQDVRYALRQMRKSPGFTTVAVLSLALGIGANTAIFTLIHALILKSLPVRAPQQLVSFGEAVGGGEVDGIGPGPLDLFPYDFYKQVERQHDPFQGVCATGSFPITVSVRQGGESGGLATQAVSHLVSGNYFSVLGADPILGRPITPEDTDAAGGRHVAVISYRYWQQELSADQGAVGQDITVNGTPFTVIGVMPPKFFGTELNEESPDMWLPITAQPEVMLQPSLLNPHGLFWLHLMARLRDGVSARQSQAWATTKLQQFMMAREGAQVSQKRQKEIGQIRIDMLPGGHGVSHLRAQFEQPLLILMGVVGLVLAIACANLANFLLSKSASREREFSTRLALGASNMRIARQILTEALLLSGMGGLLGLVVAFWGTHVLVAFVVAGAKHTTIAANPDLVVLAFTFGISLLTGILFGIAPSLRTSRIGSAPALSATARTAVGTGGRSGRLFPRILLVAQVGLSLVLLVGAGLFVRTLQNLKNQDLGFNRRNLLLLELNAKLAGYKSEQLPGLYERILSRLNALPGVTSAALSGTPPIYGGSWDSPIFVQGYTPAPNEDISTLINRVSPEYFSATGIPLLSGRSIGGQDVEGSTKIVVVNQSLADHFFPHGDAIGHQFRIADPSVPGAWQIVGVVRDAKYNSPRENPKRMIYLPLAQLTGDDRFAYSLQVRTTGDPANIASEVRTALAEIDPNLPLLHVRTIAEQVDLFMENERLISQLSTFFALLALALACIGLYGVMAYNVTRRTNEIGVRMALGAQNGTILWMVLRESLMLLGIGVAIGIPAALAATRLVRAQLFGLSSSDPATFVAAAMLIAAVVVLAAYGPARRAAKIDPMVALRYE
ncbi:MAG: ABC transporter permease [Candidatus Sulfotelmatobacter sp.]